MFVKICLFWLLSLRFVDWYAKSMVLCLIHLGDYQQQQRSSKDINNECSHNWSKGYQSVSPRFRCILSYDSDIKLFDDYQPYKGTDIVMIGNGQNLEIKHIGKVTLPTSLGDVVLYNVLHLSQLKQSLLSISQLTSDLNCDFKFHLVGFLVSSKGNRRVIFRRTKSQNLYKLDLIKHYGLFSNRQ